MNKRVSILLTTTLAAISMFFLQFASQNKTNIYIGMLLATTSLGIGIFNIVLKEENNTKRKGFYLILFIGILFLAFGLLVK